MIEDKGVSKLEPSTAMQVCPSHIGEWIDEDILPNYADGTRSAEQIYNEVLEVSKNAILREEKDVHIYEKSMDIVPLLDSWLILPQHKQIFVGYIQFVFNQWERESSNRD